MNGISKWLLPILIATGVVTTTVAKPTRGETADVICLAKNIYHEARGESLRGRKAVAQVTLNRVRTGKFGNDVCEVVYKPGQFSWTKSKRRAIITDWDAWNDSLALAKTALKNNHVVGFENFKAIYFHTRGTHPRWHQRVYAKIDNHVFYTLKEKNV